MKTLLGSTFGRGDAGVVVRTRRSADLSRIALPEIAAVVFTPIRQPSWMSDLAKAVGAGDFHVPRSIVTGLARADLRAWFEEVLPRGTVDDRVRRALVADLLSLATRVQDFTESSRLMLRVLTGTPSWHCGFHVDTVAPGVHRCGILRVYNGAATRYVEAANVTTTRDFYRYLAERERRVRQWADAGRDADAARSSALLQRIKDLDEERTFLRKRRAVRTVPAGAIVAFKHLDVGLHWSNHPAGLAWIHCSPMRGLPRFLVNVSAAPERG